MNDLDLRKVSEEESIDSSALEIGRVIEVYSKRFEEALNLKITHNDDTYGGTILNLPESPLLGKADHVHFSKENVLTVQGDR